MSKIKKWTEEEFDLIRKHYPKKGSTWCAIRLDRNPHAVRDKAYRLKVKKIITYVISRCKYCKIELGIKNQLKACEDCKQKNRKETLKHIQKCRTDLFSKGDIEYIKTHYYQTPKEEMIKYLCRTWSAIIHKAVRLKVSRNQEYFRLIGIRKFNKEDNPSKRPEVRLKRSIQMKEFIKNNPEKALNSRLRRNKKTYIESEVEGILIKHNIKFKYNKYIKTKASYRFPDFLIENLIIECDGHFFHKDKKKETERDRELMALGFSILHFSGKKIRNNIEVVERCILKKLKQLNIMVK